MSCQATSNLFHNKSIAKQCDGSINMDAEFIGDAFIPLHFNDEVLYIILSQTGSLTFWAR